MASWPNQLFIDNKWVDGASGKTWSVVTRTHIPASRPPPAHVVAGPHRRPYGAHPAFRG